MLVLSRKLGEQIQIGDQITITINQIGANGIRVGVEAPHEVAIMRGELLTRIGDRQANNSPNAPEGLIDPDHDAQWAHG